MRQDISSVDPAVQRVNAQIQNMVEGRLQYYTTREISEMYVLKESIAQNVNIRDQMIINESKNAKDELNLQHQQLLSRINAYVSSVKSERGGVMSPVVDGLEDTLTFDSMKDLTREETLMKVDYDKIIIQKDVKKDAPLFKIIASNIWYIAAYIPNDSIAGFEEGDTRTLYLETRDEYIPMAVYVERIDQGYRESFALFKCTKYMIEFLNTRNINIKTSGNIRSGYKISNTAIASRVCLVIPKAYLYENGNKYQVIKQAGEEEIIIPLASVRIDGDNAYVPLGSGDLSTILSTGDVITRPGAYPPYELTDTQEEYGVYKINNGYADFKRIVLDTEISTASGYTILNPALNTSIKTYDYIVSDAAGVTDGQIIY
jgi:hypothetical protein